MCFRCNLAAAGGSRGESQDHAAGRVQELSHGNNSYQDFVTTFCNTYEVPPVSRATTINWMERCNKKRHTVGGTTT